ncbi:MAG: prepilin-type N-terminal cleavage/methylation domain-containing protein [Candidatus Omnitrophota bacterium]
MRIALWKSRAGLSLVEVLVSTSIILIAVIGILLCYIKAIELNAIGQGAVIASHAVKSKIEEIKSTNFAQIYSTYNGATFTTAGLTGIGKIYVNNSSAHLLKVKIVFCWRMQGGRVIGDDKNLNGTADAGEHVDGNGEFSSYVQIITQIYG